MKLAKFLIKRDTSWEITYHKAGPSKPVLYKYSGNSKTEKKVAEGNLMSFLGQEEGGNKFKKFLNLSQAWYKVSLSFCEHFEICLLREFVLYLGNSCVISSHVPIDIGLNEYNQLFALSFKEKGKTLSLIISIAPS